MGIVSLPGRQYPPEGMKNIDDAKSVYIIVEKENPAGTNSYRAKELQVVSKFDNNFKCHINKMLKMALNI